MLDLLGLQKHDAEAITAVNPPFLTRIAYRDDEYSAIRFKLLELLEEAFPSWNSQLANNQGPQDFGVLMVEAFSYLAEIIGFYQDCRANESYLRTASLPASLIDICALIDYRIPAGASASVLQTFICKDGQSGIIPAGFQIKTRARDGKPALVFEMSRDLKVDAARNVLRLSGHNRSTRVINAKGSSIETSALLDNGYAGLVAGSYVVFEWPERERRVVRLTAINEKDGKRQISWAASSLPADINLPIADLVIHGNPQQTMKLAASARADEIAAGQLTARVSDPSILSLNDHVVFANPIAFHAAIITNISGSAIVWNSGFNLPLRRSETTLYKGRKFAKATGEIKLGDRSITTERPCPPAAQPGDLIILSDDCSLCVLRVGAVRGDTYYLTEGVPRTYPDGGSLHRVTLANAETNVAGSPHTTFLQPTEDCDSTQVTLDKTYQGLKAGSILVLSDGEDVRVNLVAEAQVNAQDQTVLSLEQPLDAPFQTRTLTIHGLFKLTMRIDGHDRALGAIPAGLTRVTVDGAAPGLQPGDDLILQCASHVEAARIVGLKRTARETNIDLLQPLQHSYPLADTRIYGNVVAATHGESIVEKVLGSGDQSLVNQEFALRKKPTSFVHDAAGAHGVTNTLEVFVADERWVEVDSLADCRPDDHVYVVLINEDELMSIRFGDGRNGAKLPTGRDNVRVRYRVGLGTAGNVEAGEINMISQLPSFLKSARNFMAASGGADRPSVEQVKQSAPMTVRTLDRAVSVVDYQDLALSHAGIAKARAYWTREAGRSVVRLVVAAIGGNPLNAALKSSLAAFLDLRRSPEHTVLIEDYKPFPVRLTLETHVLPNFTRAETIQRIVQALGAGAMPDGTLGYFHFDRRGLGEDLYLSEVYALVEGLRGVDYVVAKAFYAESDLTAAVKSVIRVPDDAVATGGYFSPPAAELLVLQTVGGIA